MRKSSRILLAVVALALVMGSAATPASASRRPIGEWKFNNSFKNSAKTPLKMTDVPAGSTAFLTTNVLGIMKPACFVAAGNGLKVTRIPRAARETYTLDLFFTTNDVVPFKRLISFGPNNVDRGLYMVGGYVQLYPGKAGANASLAATWAHVAVTRSGTSDRMKVYVDGVLELSYLDKKGQFLLRRGTVVIFQDDGSEHNAGFIKGFRVYDQVLTPD